MPKKTRAAITTGKRTRKPSPDCSVELPSENPQLRRVAEIRRLLNAGYSARIVSRRLGITEETVTSALRSKRQES